MQQPAFLLPSRLLLSQRPPAFASCKISVVNTFTMAGDKVPSLQSLESPEKLQEMLQKERAEDCLSCKVVGKFCLPIIAQLKSIDPESNDYLAGCGALFGLSAYNYFSGMSQLEKQRHVIMKSQSMFGMRSRQATIASISFGLA